MSDTHPYSERARERMAALDAKRVARVLVPLLALIAVAFVVAAIVARDPGYLACAAIFWLFAIAFAPDHPDWGAHRH